MPRILGCVPLDLHKLNTERRSMHTDGAATTQAVCDFQRLNGMSTTGIADEEMQKRLYSDQAVARTD